MFNLIRSFQTVLHGGCNILYRCWKATCFRHFVWVGIQWWIRWTRSLPSWNSYSGVVDKYWIYNYKWVVWKSVVKLICLHVLFFLVCLKIYLHNRLKKHTYFLIYLTGTPQLNQKVLVQYQMYETEVQLCSQYWTWLIHTDFQYICPGFPGFRGNRKHLWLLISFASRILLSRFLADLQVRVESHHYCFSH